MSEIWKLFLFPVVRKTARIISAIITYIYIYNLGFNAFLLLPYIRRNKQQSLNIASQLSKLNDTDEASLVTDDFNSYGKILLLDKYKPLASLKQQLPS